MSAADLEAWMLKNRKDVIDVASLTKIHPNTVKAYLKGERDVHRSTEAAFERLIRESQGVPRATG